MAHVADGRREARRIVSPALDKAILRVLGRVARISRRIGLGALLRVGRDILDEAYVRTGRPPLRVALDGLKFNGFLRHRSVLEGIGAGKYETHYSELFERALKPGMIVIDGGAYIGLYTLIAARRIGEAGTVIAFEPDPYNFQALSFNVARNRATNVVPVRKALSNCVGTMPFYQSASTLSSSLIERHGVDWYGRTEAEVTTLDRELPSVAGASILVKLDLEGAECLALQGMRKTLQRNVSAVLFVEVNPAALRDAGFQALDLCAELEHLGFRIDTIDEQTRTLVPLAESGPMRKGNLYCTRTSSRRPRDRASLTSMP